MFVVIDPQRKKTFGSFVTFEEAIYWCHSKSFRDLSHDWYISKVEQVQSDCAMASIAEKPSNPETDCC